MCRSRRSGFMCLAVCCLTISLFGCKSKGPEYVTVKTDANPGAVATPGSGGKSSAVAGRAELKAGQVGGSTESFGSKMNGR